MPNCSHTEGHSSSFQVTKSSSMLRNERKGERRRESGRRREGARERRERVGGREKGERERERMRGREGKKEWLSVREERGRE